jgi:hypothetical protein
MAAKNAKFAKEILNEYAKLAWFVFFLCAP